MKGTPFKLKQKLKPAAAKRKAEADQKAAMTAWGKFKKRTAQRANCPKGHDFDHALFLLVKIELRTVDQVQLNENTNTNGI